MVHTWSRRCAIALAGTASTWATAAAAQNAPLQAAPAATRSADSVSDSPSDIVVTAQKREQSLQDVPIVVTVVNAQLARDAGVRDIKDLTILTPGLTVISTSNETQSTAFIRGVGTAGSNIGLESAVGVVVDGVYRPRTGIALGDLGNIERIEVLKGPQGTLFGKNTSAGVINVVTAQPTFTPHGQAEATIGNYGEIGASAWLSGPIIGDTLAASLSVVKRERDGLYDIGVGIGPRTQRDDATRNYWSLRGQLLFNTGNFSARLIGDITRRDETCCSGVQLVAGPTAAYIQTLTGGTGLLTPPDPGRRLAFSNRGTTQNVRDGGVSLEMNLNLGDTKLTSLTAWRDWRWLTGSDSDYSGADIVYRADDGNTYNRFRQFSQELRATGTLGILDYTVGGFYAHERIDSAVAQLYGTQFQPYLSLLLTGGANPNFLQPVLGLATPGTGSRDLYVQDGDSYALFTNNTIRLAPKLELTVGLRYTIDRKEAVANFNATDGGRFCNGLISTGSAALIGALCIPLFNPNFIGVVNTQRRTEHALSGTAKLAYRFSDALLTYASYSRGYKSGGFNLDRVANPYAAGNPNSLKPILDTSFPGEFVDSYEIGFKSTLADRRLYFNAAGFYQEFSNFQLNAFNGFYFSVFPIPKVISKGFDADILWRPSRRFTLQGGITYADTRYTESDRPLLSLTPTTAALPGQRLNQAPLWSGSLSATWEVPLWGRVVARPNVNVLYRSSFSATADLNPAGLQSAYAVVNARIGIGDEDRRWTIEAWAQNLTNKLYFQSAYPAPLQSGTYDAYLGAPRTYGLTFRVGF